MATKKSKKKAAKKAKRSAKTATKEYISYRGVQVAFLEGGADAVEKLKASKLTLRRAARTMTGKKGDSLRKWVSEKFPRGVKGKAAPIVGETREYTVQQLKKTGGFLRLPTDTLKGSKKGSKLKVKFGEDKILVERS